MQIFNKNICFNSIDFVSFAHANRPKECRRRSELCQSFAVNAVALQRKTLGRGCHRTTVTSDNVTFKANCFVRVPLSLVLLCFRKFN